MSAFPIQNDPYASNQKKAPGSSHSQPPGGPPSNEPIQLASIDTTSTPDTVRASFRNTDYDTVLPLIRARFPNVDPLYWTKIYRGTITSPGLVWLDVDREGASPPDHHSLAHLLYCFEIYGQIVCILADPQGGDKEVELQRALSEYRVRLLKLSKWATFESLREWHHGVVEVMMREGQDKAEGWRRGWEEMAGVLRKKM